MNYPLQISHRGLRGWRGILSLWLLAAMPISVFGEENENIVPPQLVTPIHALVPTAIAHYSLPDYYADFMVRVGTDGRVIDVVCVEASHPGLISRAASALRNARFRPATENGTPFIADINHRINFHHTALGFTGTVDQTGLDHIENTLTYLDPDAFRFKSSSPRDLDEPLRIVRQEQTFVPTDAEGNPVHGSAVVEFYVARDGTPRLPSIIRSDHLAVSDAALQNVSHSRFNEPRSGGKATVVKVRMPLNFSP